MYISFTSLNEEAIIVGMACREPKDLPKPVNRIKYLALLLVLALLVQYSYSVAKIYITHNINLPRFESNRSRIANKVENLVNWLHPGTWSGISQNVIVNNSESLCPLISPNLGE